MTPKKFSQLLTKWRTGTISPDEAREFILAVRTGAHDGLLDEAFEADQESGWFQQLSTVPELENDWKLVSKRLHTTTPRIPHRVHFLKTAWFRVAIAILLFAGIGAYLWLQNSKPILETASTQPVLLKNDIMPGSDKATLTLADGQKISLDSNANKLLSEKGITNNNALIVYSGKGETNAFNTLATPNGGQYKIRLSDGTMVWLNAASSITYPIVFTGNTRTVTITGEVYLDVQADKSKPFIVKTKDDRIEVLGTAFNINAYKDEPATRTTVISGRVKVNESIINPMQAYIKGKIVPAQPSCAAWKEGRFNLEGVTVEECMRQLARWYDLEIKYVNGIPGGRFAGEMDRNLNLSDVLEFLKGSGINFEINGKKLIVINKEK